ncbi:hypothetical protein ACOTVD_09195 [Campylobacter jejuni]|uniref:hypothetical protein n=1 Tax=Campylobacter jejuni TaxID=197 RepID=UPI003B9BE231
MKNQEYNVENLKICNESYDDQRVFTALDLSYKMQTAYNQNQTNSNQNQTNSNQNQTNSNQNQTNSNQNDKK